VTERLAETDLAGLFASKPVELNEDKGDKKGPITIASAVSADVTNPAPKPDEKDAPGRRPRRGV
jgi:hypothetical protein